MPRAAALMLPALARQRRRRFFGEILKCRHVREGFQEISRPQTSGSKDGTQTGGKTNPGMIRLSLICAAAMHSAGRPCGLPVFFRYNSTMNEAMRRTAGVTRNSTGKSDDPRQHLCGWPKQAGHALHGDDADGGDAACHQHRQDKRHGNRVIAFGKSAIRALKFSVRYRPNQCECPGGGLRVD
ncbi:hypothetical protein [Rhizobium yanglingense]